MDFKNICLYETGKVVLSARIKLKRLMAPSSSWVAPHVERTCNTHHPVD